MTQSEYPAPKRFYTENQPRFGAPKVIMEALEHPPIPYDPHHDDNLAHVHMAGQCARKIWYEMNTTGGLGSMPMVVGIAIHEILQDSISGLDLENVETEVVVDFRTTPPTFPIKGKADLVTPTKVIDLKTTSATGLIYRKKDRTAEQNHILQTAIYAVRLNRPLFGIFYLERDRFKGFAYYEYETREFVDLVAAELVRLRDVYEANSVPEPINGQGIRVLNNEEENWQCRYCDFSIRCNAVEQSRK